MKTFLKTERNALRNRLFVFSVVLFFMIFFLLGCSSLELNSSWRSREVVIDGRSDDWVGNLYYFEDENISLGILNDENDMYLCMIAEEQFMRAQVMGQGLTIWFDPDGGREKTFGVRFPIGMEGSRGQKTPTGMREEEPEPDREKFREAMAQSMSHLEILRPGKDERERMPIKEVKGIDVVLKPSSGMLVYELKIPLHRSREYPYAVGAKAGSLIGVGLEIPELDRSALRKSMGDRPGGRMPPGGMGGRSGGMGMRGGRRPNIPHGLKFWASVQLASGES